MTRPYKHVEGANKIKIEKGIPIPDGRQSNGGREEKYPFKSMAVGDSFLFPNGATESSCYAIGYYWSRKTKQTFKVRKTDQGMRCWRVD